MTPTETAVFLRRFNEWRRGDYSPEDQPAQPDPREIGLAIDAAVEMIERMENQVPIGWFARVDGDGPLMECKHADISRVPLYTLPGAQAQPAPSISPAALRPVIQWLRNGCDPVNAADELELLAAAPEAKS